MKYFGSPGSCSLSPHIALREAGLPFEYVKVDLRAKRTADDGDYRAINPKGYVPALMMEDGKLLTENPVILQWVADQAPAKKLAPANGTMERYRFQEWLNFICSELHKTVFAPQFNPRASDEWKQVLRGLMEARFAVVEARLKDRQYMIGDGFTLADSYLFTIVRWTGPMKIDLSPWPALKAHQALIAERPHVKAAMQAEGLI
ncbi:MAG TPA: glutathione transferase GstA [Stellaceae bacterium]|nr:glutathione transferase GstA [Stellaceae bacterium]